MNVFKEVEFYSRPLLNRLHLLHILIPLLLCLFFLNSHLLLLPYVLVVVTEGIPDAKELLQLGIFYLALISFSKFLMQSVLMCTKTK